MENGGESVRCGVSAGEPGRGDASGIGPAAHSSELVGEAASLILGARVREGVRLLERWCEDREGDLDCATAACQWLAFGHGLLGHEEDAREWFARGQRRALTPRGRIQLAWTAPLQVVLAYLDGDDVLAVRLANQSLAQTAPGGQLSGQATSQMALVGTMAMSYLRLAQIEKAQQCVQSLPGDPTGECDERSVRGLGAWLAAELAWSRSLAHSAAVRAHILYIDEWPAASGAGPGFRFALECFASANELLTDWPLARLQVECGLRACALAIGCDRERAHHKDSRLRELEAQFARDGLESCSKRAALMRGIAHLARSDGAAARAALLGPSARILDGMASPFALDSLYFGALACRMAGDSVGATLRLTEFLVRVRERHLLRAVLPPPLTQAGAIGPIPAKRALVEEEDDVLVARVTALVHDDPTQPLSSDGLAVLFGVSKRTLQYRFRRATGKTPKEFVTELRIKRAREELQADFPCARSDLERVAGSAGFST